PVDLSAIEGVSDGAQAAGSAIADYNATGTRIQIMEASPGDIAFVHISQFGDPNVIAQGSFPAWANTPGKPGSTITVSDNHNSFSVGQKEKVVAHEFGHNIGLRHDNAIALEGTGDVGAELITGTPSSD